MARKWTRRQWLATLLGAGAGLLSAVRGVISRAQAARPAGPCPVCGRDPQGSVPPWEPAPCVTFTYDASRGLVLGPGSDPRAAVTTYVYDASRQGPDRYTPLSSSDGTPA